MPPKDLKRITSYIPPSTHDVLENWAEQEGRTVSNLVNRIVARAVDSYFVKKSKKNESNQDNSGRT